MREPGPSEPPTVVAAFDFDGTLTDGGSVFPFLVALRGRRKVLQATLRHSPGLLHAALVGGTVADRVKEKLFVELLSGLPVEDVNATSEAFAEHHLARHLRPGTADRLTWHRTQGHHVLIISASPETYVRAAGTRLGVDDIVATRLAVGSDGRLTGHYEGRNCRGAEKLARLNAHLESAGLTGPGGERPELWAYGNSRGDLRLLGAADHGVDVSRLGRFGRLRGFPRLAEVTRDVPAAAG